MRFTCYKNDLVEALQILIHSVAVKPMTPILSGIYLNLTEDGLEMQANNFSSGTTLRIPVTAESYGEAVVSGKRFQDFIRGIPDDIITLFGEEAAPTFAIESGGAHIDLLTMPATEFPKVKRQDTFGSFRIRANTLKNLIRKTVFAVSKDNERPVFKGCCFEIKDNRINVLATNAQRIAFASDVIQNHTPERAASFVVPPDVLRCLMQSFDPNDVENMVEVSYSDRIVNFEFDNVFMTSRLIDGEFPAYDKAFETDFSTRVEVSRLDLRGSVELIALTAREAEYNAIKFEIVPGYIKISSFSPDVGEAYKTIEADVSGDETEIAFNAEYLIDVLRVLETSRISIQLGGRYDPVLFREDKNDNYSYVTTPVRI